MQSHVKNSARPVFDNDDGDVLFYQFSSLSRTLHVRKFTCQTLAVSFAVDFDTDNVLLAHKFHKISPDKNWTRTSRRPTTMLMLHCIYAANMQPVKMFPDDSPRSEEIVIMTNSCGWHLVMIAISQPRAV